MAPGKSAKALKDAAAAAPAAAPETDVVDDKEYPKSVYKGDLHGEHKEEIVNNPKQEAAAAKRGFKDQTGA